LSARHVAVVLFDAHPTDGHVSQDRPWALLARSPLESQEPR
jgi:hypothetical protein